jgi:hypothetical protein
MTVEILDDSLTTFLHILDTPIPDDPTWFIDGSSTKASTTSIATVGYAIIERHPNNTYAIIETNSLPPITTFQQAELYALITKGKRQDSLHLYRFKIYIQYHPF